jgi:T5SS/PEP-CTERM-associated repeat protein
VISGTGTVTSTEAYIGLGSYAFSNSVLVTGSNSLWSNSGNLVIGAGEAIGNSLIVTNGGQVQSGQITVTTGILEVGVTNGLGDSAVILGGGSYNATLSLSTNVTLTSLSDFDWASNGVIALAQGTHTLTLGGMTNSAGTNDGGNVFQFLNSTLSNDTNVLINYGSLADFTTNSFSVQGITGYSFSTNNNQVSAYLSTNANVDVCSDITISNTLTVESFTVGCASTTTVAPTGTLNASDYVLVTDNSTLIDNGLIVTPSLTVDQGSTLMGAGTLSLTGGNLSVNGTIAPGNSPGTFYVSGGNLVMGSTAVWDQQIYSSSVYDRVVVTGAAYLNGTMNITSYGNGELEYGQQFNFLSASGGVSGAFSSIIAPAGYRGRLLLSGNNTQANILIAPASYTQLAANRNQSNVAKALDSFIPSTSGDQLTVSISLDSLTASEYNQAFNAIMPTFYQQIATIAFNQANAQNMQLNQRLWGLRLAEGGGFSMSGLAGNFPILEGQGDGADKGVLDSKKDILRPGLDNHWGMFVDGNGIFAQANSGNMLPGYNSQSGGVTTGLTYKWNDNFASGIYCGYQGTYTKSGANGSGLGTGSSLIDNAVRFGVFGTYGQKDGKGLYANALAGGGYHNFQATRVIQYTGMNRTANSAPGAGELDTMLATGYDIQKGKFTFGPTASLQYTYLGVNSVNETGAQSLDFNSGGWNSSSMLSSVGAHAAYSLVVNRNVVLVPQINLSWQHEFMQNPYAISGNLGGTSPTFANWSATPIRDFLYTGVGFTVEFAKRWNTSFFYNASAGNSDLVSQNIFWSAGVKF